MCYILLYCYTVIFLLVHTVILSIFLLYNYHTLAQSIHRRCSSVDVIPFEYCLFKNNFKWLTLKLLTLSHSSNTLFSRHLIWLWRFFIFARRGTIHLWCPHKKEAKGSWNLSQVCAFFCLVIVLGRIEVGGGSGGHKIDLFLWVL